MALDGTASVQAKAYLGSKENALLVPNSDFGRRKYVNVKVGVGTPAKSAADQPSPTSPHPTTAKATTMSNKRKSLSYEILNFYYYFQV